LPRKIYIFLKKDSAWLMAFVMRNQRFDTMNDGITKYLWAKEALW
jgi:hypothetical protein